MTSFRSLAASIFLVLSGCAVIPGAADDTICLNCATPDAGDASFLFDGGLGGEAGLVPSGARSTLCVGPCNPKDSKATPDNPTACLVKDGGTSVSDGGGYNGSELACRVVQTTSQGTASECVAAGSHGDGASCTSGADCAPGFECVGTPGACHHYCCDDAFCTSNTIFLANNPGNYFCDVQPEAASANVKVPVCMLAQPCDLLQNGCGDGMTCTLVDALNSDLTSCVAIGTAQVGESCEINHCAADMICVGPYGQRTCQQLCDQSVHTCTYPQQCDSQWPQLAKFNVGICE